MSPLGHAPLCSKQTTELCVEALDVQVWSSGEHLGLRKSHSLWDVYLDAVWESNSPATVGRKDQGSPRWAESHSSPEPELSFSSCR